MLERHLVLPIEPEVALNGEGCLLDFGLGYDLGRTLGLALDPLRDWGISACRFAYRAVVFPLAVGSYGARHALVFQLAVRAGLALRAAVFVPPVPAPLHLPCHHPHSVVVTSSPSVSSTPLNALRATVCSHAKSGVIALR